MIYLSNPVSGHREFIKSIFKSIRLVPFMKIAFSMFLKVK